MVRKDEPLKVTDLEASEEATSSKSAAKKGVFNRLAYGAKNDPSKIEEANEIPDVSKPGAKKTGKLAGKSSGNASKSGPNKNIKSTAANVDGQQQQQPISAGSASVFDRLTSGERFYRTTTQTGRKPAGRRAEQTADVIQEHGKEIASKIGNQAANDAGVSPQTDEMVNGSHKLDEVDASDEEDDPVIEISLIQPPVKIRSARPVLKKSARLLLSQREQLVRRKSWRLRRIPVALVERTSLAKGALPILPQGLAWMCLVLNGLLPGTGTIMSGMLGICLGAPRFSAQVTVEHRLLAFIVNLTVGIFQAFTVLFCLVGWCWSLGWGIILVKTAGCYKRWKRNTLDRGQEDVPQMNSIGIVNNVDPRY